MHSRRSSTAGQQQRPQHHHAHSHSHRSTRHEQPASAKHHRTNTDPETPTLLRLPSSTSSGASLSPRSRRATNPSTPTLNTSQLSSSDATSPSYFSPQTSASTKEARSPGFRRPPASFSGHGIDNSRGPPITLITRGNSDIARRPSQKPSDFAFAQQQLLQSGIVSPGGPRSTRRRKDVADESSELAENSQSNTPTISRPPSSSGSSRHHYHMASSAAESSEYDSGLRSHSDDRHAMHDSHGALDPTRSDEEHAEDLFLNIAEDSGPRKGSVDAGLRNDRLRSRIARANNHNHNRQSLPSALQPGTSSASRIPASNDIKPGNQYRRSSHLPSSSRNLREQSPMSPASVTLETPRSRVPDLSPKPSFPSGRKDAELSPREFLARIGGRRPSFPDAAQTPPNRTSTYRPSNLNYSSSRHNTRTPQAETPQEPQRGDGTESHGSTGPATSVWDELDDLKSRIRRIELGGKIPTTSGAAVAQASAERPRTANTSVTTMSSSPKQQRKDNTSPSESTVDTQIPSRVHPLLKEALAKTRQHISPAIYRVLEATAAEAMTLAELTGSGGPQGTLHSASSILSGASVPDRQVRRKADNICRNLTELCIAMCDSKTAALASPALRSTAASVSRRPSVQINGDSPTIRQSVEPEGNSYSGVSPSRALARIESRRTSMLVNNVNGGRETSQEPLTPSHIPRNFSRAGTSLQRTRRGDDLDDEDPTLRAPSRAMTDFREARATDKRRYSRQYTSREPMPDLQPSPALQHPSSLRRPTVTGIGNENQFYAENSRLFNLNRESSPAYDKRATGDFTPRTQYNSNRHSIIGVTGLGRSGSLNRRLRGTSAGE